MMYVSINFSENYGKSDAHEITWFHRQKCHRADWRNQDEVDTYLGSPRNANISWRIFCSHAFNEEYSFVSIATDHTVDAAIGAKEGNILSDHYEYWLGQLTFGQRNFLYFLKIYIFHFWVNNFFNFIDIEVGSS